MDAFYASIEQREDPSLVGRPVIVGAVSRRGVVAAASYEARRFGVRSAMPAFRARELCPDAVFLPSNMPLYAEVSDQVHSVFEEFTSDIEPLALDEAFLDVSGSIRLFGNARDLARRLKELVYDRTQLRVSVGVAPSKLVAKIACSQGKPDGLRVVEEVDVESFLAPLPIRALWGVGPVTARALHAAGIATLGDLVRHDATALRELVGDRAAALQQLARGRDERPVIGERTARSIGEENTFESDVLDRQVVLDAVTGHAEAVARRARRSGLKARTITLKLRLATARGRKIARGRDGGLEPLYPQLTRSRTLESPTDDAAAIRDVAMTLWDREKLREPIRLIGVTVSQLEVASKQLSLFDPREASDGIGPVMDTIREKFGSGAVFRGAKAPQKITHGGRRKLGDD